MDFTLSNAKRFYSSLGNPSDTEGLRRTIAAKLPIAHKIDNEYLVIVTFICLFATRGQIAVKSVFLNTDFTA